MANDEPAASSSSESSRETNTEAATDLVALDPRLQRIVDEVPAPQRDLLLCAACGLAITSDSARISAGGSHEHHFTNPFGIQFHSGCFDPAPGCSVLGPPQHADTWFANHLWRLAACGECGTHLGWWFEHAASAEASAFYGLILPRLRTGKPGKSKSARR